MKIDFINLSFIFLVFEGKIFEKGFFKMNKRSHISKATKALRAKKYVEALTKLNSQQISLVSEKKALYKVIDCEIDKIKKRYESVAFDISKQLQSLHNEKSELNSQYCYLINPDITFDDLPNLSLDELRVLYYTKNGVWFNEDTSIQEEEKLKKHYMLLISLWCGCKICKSISHTQNVCPKNL